MSRQVKIIIEDNGKYLLVRRADKEKKEHYGNWESPGGKLEENESFESAAIREAKEETNLDVKIVKIVKKLEKDGEVQAIVFLAKPLTKKIKISKEHSDYGWFTFEELKKLEPITYRDFFFELLELARKHF